jgi:hypothetical protein
LLTCKSASRWMDRFGEVSTIEIPDPEWCKNVVHYKN